MKNTQLSQIIPTDTLDEKLKEVLKILPLISIRSDIEPVKFVYGEIVSLYNGDHPEYRACNTEYHNLTHVLDVFLAISRLIHGAVEEGFCFSDRLVICVLMASLLHDTGYIQEIHDTEGTGAKYSTHHVQKSIRFTARHGREFGLDHHEIKNVQKMIQCTELTVDISKIEFGSTEVELLGKILGTADLIAQMADRAYLEKLLFLYYEFKEAGFGDYNSYKDLLLNTLDFYKFVDHRLKTMLGGTDGFMKVHFSARWGINKNLYKESIDSQHSYLKRILETEGFNPGDYFRRGEILQ